MKSLIISLMSAYSLANNVVLPQPVIPDHQNSTYYSLTWNRFTTITYVDYSSKDFRNAIINFNTFDAKMFATGTAMCWKIQYTTENGKKSPVLYGATNYNEEDNKVKVVEGKKMYDLCIKTYNAIEKIGKVTIQSNIVTNKWKYEASWE